MVVEIATPSEDFTSATYSVKYTASSGLLTITSSAKLPKGFTGIGNLASAAVGSTPVFQTTIPSQLKVRYIHWVLAEILIGR